MTVSIIIPTYNARPFVERALNCALGAGAQVKGGWEVLVVDDGSTDGTAAVVQQAVGEYAGRLRLVQTTHRGAAAARNTGVRQSRGEWVQFLDADDRIAPNKISHQLALAGSAEWVVGAYQHRYSDGTTEDVLPHPDLWRGLFYNFRTGHTISNLLRRTALDRIGGWNEALASNQDPDLAFRLLRAKTPFVLDNTVNSYYLHHNRTVRITQQDAAGRLRRRINLFGEASAYLHRLYPAYWEAHAPFFLGALLRAIRMEATFDLEAATAHYRTYFGPHGPYSQHSALELVPTYTRLYPYLGFRALERLRLRLAGVLSPALKRRLKT